MTQPLTTRAPAKINLTLHVLGRREDGYHALESLVAFAGLADRLRLEPGPDLALEIGGPTAMHVAEGVDNLVLKAARLLAERVRGLRVGRFQLDKRLPVAAGIGGGSSDAAAALRLLARLNGLPLSDPALIEAAARTGADVPVCLEGRARMMAGAGERLGSPLALPGLFAVLVNPGVPVETASVFRALGLAPGTDLDRPGHPRLDLDARDALFTGLARARNDLEGPAMRLQPAVAEALAVLRRNPACRLARMSGSGATVFGLFDDCRQAARAARSVRREWPRWWVKATLLR